MVHHGLFLLRSLVILVYRTISDESLDIRVEKTPVNSTSLLGFLHSEVSDVYSI